MNWSTIIWGITTGACLMLAAVHCFAYCCDRTRRADLLFSLTAFSVGVFALLELALMHAPSPEVFLALHRWANVAIGVTIAAMIAFIQYHLRSGRIWLGCTVVVLRMVVVVMSFVPGPTFQFREVSKLVPVDFLGSTIVVPIAEPSPWARLSEGTSLLAIAFIVDAAVRLWRRGGAYRRRQALVVGGGAFLFMTTGVTGAFLVQTGLWTAPYTISLSFLVFLAAMGFELGRDRIHATRLAEELAENAKSMALSAEAAQLAHWRWDIPRDLIWVTDPGRGLYGLKEAEPIDFERFLRTLHPEDRASTRQAVEEALAGDGMFSGHYRVLLPDGSARWIEALARTEYSDGKPQHMLGISRDVTEQKRIQDRFRLTVEAAPNGVVLSDSDGHIVLVNRRAEELFGYERGEMLQVNVEALVPVRLRRKHAKFQAQFTDAPVTRPMGADREVFALRKDGSEFPAEIGLNVVESVEGSLILSTVVDITARREAETEARHLREELAHVTRVSTLSELSASLAHELNHPLAIILSNAQAAQRLMEQDPPNLTLVKEILSDIVAEDLRASEVMKRLRALFKRGETTMAPLSLNKAIEEIIGLCHRDLRERGHGTSLDLATDLPRVEADQVQLRQVLLNLILNAADAMSASPAGKGQIHVSTRSRGDSVQVTIRDEGCGLPAHSETLFKPFYTTKPHGLGMGLPVCQSIIVAHGGRIWAEPGPDGGAAFHFELPMLKDEPVQKS